MKEILLELERRNLPYTVTSVNSGSVILYAMGYAPFLYEKDEFEIDAFYLASNEVYSLSKKLCEKFGGSPSPNLNYKKIAEESGLGVRGKNDLIFTKEFGFCHALGAIYSQEKLEEVKKSPPSLICDKCGLCVQKCPTNALDGGFCRPSCIREQTDSGIKEETIKLLGKRIFGCNLCSLACPLNKVEFTRPPEELRAILKADNFFELCLKGKKVMQRLGDFIGVNYIRPAKLLSMAVYCSLNVECDRKKWLDSLSTYPDERVRLAVSRINEFVKE